MTLGGSVQPSLLSHTPLSVHDAVCPNSRQGGRGYLTIIGDSYRTERIFRKQDKKLKNNLFKTLTAKRGETFIHIISLISGLNVFHAMRLFYSVRITFWFEI